MSQPPEMGPPPDYIRAWREHRGLSLGKMAKLTGIQKSGISRVETGKIPYHRDILHAYARVLGCQPGDLISRPPGMGEDLFRLLALCGADDLQSLSVIVKEVLQQRSQTNRAAADTVPIKS